MQESETSAKLHPAQKFRSIRVHRSQLKNAPYNPRVIDPFARQGLKASLEDKRIGLIASLTWNQRTGHLIGGHQRLDILDQLDETGGDYLLDVDAVDMPLEIERHANPLLNSPHIQGQFDLGMLGALGKIGNWDWELAGFDQMALDLTFPDENFGRGIFSDERTPEEVEESAATLEDIAQDGAAGRRDEAAVKLERERSTPEFRQKTRGELKGYIRKEGDGRDNAFYRTVVVDNAEQMTAIMLALGIDPNEQYIDGHRLAAYLKITLPMPPRQELISEGSVEAQPEDGAEVEAGDEAEAAE